MNQANSGSDVENVLTQPLKENDGDDVKGEKRKCEQETEENTTDDQVNDSKRLKIDSVVDHDKAVKQSILDLFVPEKDRQAYYEDIDNNNQVYVEAVTQPCPQFKNYLTWIVNESPGEYQHHHSKLLYFIKTAMESFKTTHYNGELPDLFNESFVDDYVEASVCSLAEYPTKINALIESTLGEETGDETESQPNKDNGTEDGMDTELQSNTPVPSVSMTTTYYENLDAYYENLDAAGNVNDHTGDLSNDN